MRDLCYTDVTEKQHILQEVYDEKNSFNYMYRGFDRVYALSCRMR